MDNEFGIWLSKGNGEYTCSRCGSTFYSNRIYYCPVCGAEMMEEEDDEVQQ